MGLKCPCKGCEKRTLTCHGVCRQYEDWKIERAAINDYNREQNAVYLSESSLRKYWKNQRFGRHRGKVDREQRR